MGEFDFRNQNINVTSLPGSPSQDGTDATGVNQPTGGIGIRGWLSGIYNLLFSGSAKVNTILTGSILAEQKTNDDAVDSVITFSANITAIEIYHEELTWQTFTVNALALKIPAGGYRTPIGGTAGATVIIPTGISCIVGRLI